MKVVILIIIHFLQKYVLNKPIPTYIWDTLYKMEKQIMKWADKKKQIKDLVANKNGSGLDVLQEQKTNGQLNYY